MTTASNSSAPKKRSPEKADADFSVLRAYILECPLLSNKSTENPAVKAALAGLDHELKRRERDAKLQKKFSQSTKLSATTNSAKETGTETKSNCQQYTSSATCTSTSSSTRQDIDDEWQDIADDRKASAVASRGEIQDEDEVEIINMEGDTSFLGEKLAESAIASIAESPEKILVRTPVAALALALHCAMRSDVLGFACTGTTDDSDKSRCSGFAAPIRELPKTQLLPKDWDKDQQRVTLRYRKNGTGSLLLKVEILENPSKESNSKEVSVKLLPTNHQEPPGQSLVFPLDHHINLDSWTTALRASNGKLGIQPALHYKGLPALLTSFAKSFDLGSVMDENQAETVHVEPSNFVGIQTGKPATHDILGKEVFGNGNGVTAGSGNPLCVGRTDRMYGIRNPTIDTAFPRPAFAGDFSGDLHPLGGMGFGDPLRRTGPDNNGSLMGPNHPVFQGGGISGIGDRSGFGMRPRFDPFGPPGGPQEIFPGGPDNGGRPNPSHLHPPQSGEPNPDHLRPPNTLGNNNMFS